MSNSNTSNPLQVKKEVHCDQCNKTTEQLLTQTPHGCDWVCTVCKHNKVAYSREQMREAVLQRLKNPDIGPKVSAAEAARIAKNYKVYLKHHGPLADEKRISNEDLCKHVEITGALPKVGQPLLTPAKGLPHLFFAVPYGEITRIIEHADEPNETNTGGGTTESNNDDHVGGHDSIRGEHGKVQ